MAKGIKTPKSYTKRGLRDFVAAEMETLLVKLDPTLKRAAVVSAATLAGAAASAYVFLSLKQQQALHLGIEHATDQVDTLVSDLGKAAYSGSANDDGGGADDEASQPTEIPRDLTVDSWAGPAAGPTFLEKNFGIARSTLHRWQKRNEVIALRSGGRKHVFPLAQFVDGRPAQGLAEVQAAFGHGRIAWRWLIEPNAMLQGHLPLDMLKMGQCLEVISTAMKQAK
ncbi:antitoxin Xre/MbcA/ParS toxin-binding domain-containing protein [Aminobacter aminovorans]|uniref:antitoxin Xre/MbcA/ParS-like domain-containing protein n=1 Tax=Aminobacter aminovorans TaxID=83263 RepID=UPI00285AED57|nr:antitoxin Xre/MbcA/ParS toxin-binding domain-containing protein [Aminobacter aminovorans]MDR7222244.1 hypothetical protein [Aminobacter aminovorans]